MNKQKARQAVQLAVKRGDIPRARSLYCECGDKAHGYHHYKGYDKAHYLDVIPLCAKCHALADDPFRNRGKLTESQVKEARKLHKDGASRSILSSMFGVNKGTMSNLLNRKSYKWVK